jgi:hypothetical protein
LPTRKKGTMGIKCPRGVKTHNIKRITLLFFIFFIFSSSWLFSRVVTKTEVETAAFNWVKLENNLKNLRLNKFDVHISTIRELIYRDTLIGYIVDLEPTGFILVPAVSELSPVKFISFSSDYDVIERHPFIETLKYRLYFTVTNLGYFRGDFLKTSDLVPSEVDTNQKERNEGAWGKLLSEDFLPEIYLSAVYLNSVSPMLTSKWSQGFPYNAHAPEIGGGHCRAGCGAISQAQVMYYWEYPTTGQGVNSYYWGGGHKDLSADFNHEYYWDRMIDDYSGSESQEQIDAVARLIYDVGISKNMNYGPGGSFSGYNPNNSLVAFFKYCSDIRLVWRSDYLSWTDWFKVHKEQMEDGWPAILSVCKTGGGCHSVVVDGYRVKGDVNQVHVNMGWGGLEDNYYTIDNIYGYGTIGGDCALINIHPPDCTNTGDISGKVTDEIGNALKDVQVKIYDQNKNHGKSAWTDSTGNYVADCLNEGTFRIFFDASQAGDYLSEWYNDKDSFDTADSVSVTAGSSTTGIDAVLAESGGIKGKVTDSSGTGIAGAGVSAYSSTGSYVNWCNTDNNGDYEIGYLKSGSYKLCFDTAYAPGMYALEWYNDKDSLEEADLISVTTGSITSGIDAVLAKGGIIKGRVTNSGGSEIDDAWIYVYTPSGGYVTDQWLDIYGYYEVRALKSRSYKIYFDATNTQGYYISEWYNDKNSIDTADLVSVTEESTTEGVDAVLSSATPRISGKVKTSIGLVGVTITFSNGGGTVFTGSLGIYSHIVSVGWSGTATPSMTNYTFDPSSRSYSDVTSDQADQDYAANRAVATTTDGEEAGKKGGCFIATAAYGSPFHSYVRILRDFRDKYLMPSKLGRKLVGIYYKYSPFVAELITKNKALKAAVRINLLPLVAFSYSMLHFGPLITVVLTVFIFILPIFLISFFRRKLRRIM